MKKKEVRALARQNGTTPKILQKIFTTDKVGQLCSSKLHNGYQMCAKNRIIHIGYPPKLYANFNS